MRAAFLTLAGGLGLVGSAYLLALTGPPRDANIGAGLLYLLGLGIAAIGAVSVVVTLVVSLVRRRRP